MNADELMAAMEQMGDMIAIWTGMRQRWIDAGWSREAAETITVELFVQQMRNTPTPQGEQ